MKKFFLFFAAIVLAVGMAACGDDEPEPAGGDSGTETPSQPGDSDDPENPDDPNNPDNPGMLARFLVLRLSTRSGLARTGRTRK